MDQISKLELAEATRAREQYDTKYAKSKTEEMRLSSQVSRTSFVSLKIEKRG